MSPDYEEKLKRYHGELVPSYSRICAAHGISNPPGICWMSTFYGERVMMAARILWNGQEPPAGVQAVDVILNPGPDDVVGPPDMLAQMVAARVIERMGSGN